jgi:spore maturation protein CgeB
MKVLYLPIGQQEGTERAFRRFADTIVFDFTQSRDPNSEFTRIALEFKPDLVHMQLQMTSSIKPETIRNLKNQLPNTIFTNWSGDIRRKPDHNYIATSTAVDYSLMSNVGQMELHEGSGCKNVRYWQIGFDKQAYYPKNYNLFKYDVSFIGNYYGNMFPDGHIRSSIAERLKNTYSDRAGIFGTGYKKIRVRACDIKDTNEIYNNSACVVSVSNFNDVSHYFSDRMLMCLASGRPTIAYRFPGSESYFTDRGDLLIANDEQQVFDLVKECLEKPEWASEIGTNGSRRVLAEHTFESRILELFSIVGLLDRVG